MDEKALHELAASIKAQGLMQPLLVRPVGRDQYELIAGERRWRAAQIAGLGEVPVLVRDVPDNAALAMALIENIQREDLNPIEEASGLQRLIEEFRMTHEQAADAVGRSRSATTNLLRLLKLAKPVQAMLMQGTLEMGHARALLGAGRRAPDRGGEPHRRARACRCAKARRSPRACSAARARAASNGPTATWRGSRRRFPQRLGTTVQIRPGRKGSGTIRRQLFRARSPRPAAEEAALTRRVDLGQSQRFLRRNTLTHSARNQYNFRALQHAGTMNAGASPAEQADPHRSRGGSCSPPQP